MTKCGIYWKKVQEFRKNDDFEGFCNWCQTGKDMLLEEWKIAEIIEKLEISSLEIGKLAADAFRPLIHKENETILSDVLPKVRSYLKNGNVLTRQKTDEFIAKAKGVPQVPPQQRRYECENCHMSTADPVRKNGHVYCSEKCKNDHFFKPTLKDTAKEYKPKDTYAYRKSLMSLPESKMDIDGLKELQARGHKVEYQPTVILVWTRPEYFVDEKAYFYNDGEAVHKGKEDRDAELRTKLAEVTHKRVFGIPYNVHSKKNVKEIADFIEDKVGKAEAH